MAPVCAAWEARAECEERGPLHRDSCVRFSDSMCHEFHEEREMLGVEAGCANSEWQRALL